MSALGSGRTCPTAVIVFCRRLQGGGGGARKAEGVCRLILPGVRTCLPFEERILHSWIGGLVAHLLHWGLRG